MSARERRWSCGCRSVIVMVSALRSGVVVHCNVCSMLVRAPWPGRPRRARGRPARRRRRARPRRVDGDPADPRRPVGAHGERARRPVRRPGRSRHLDHAARWLRAQGRRLLHDRLGRPRGQRAVAAALRPTDPALLHYRSGGFYLARARQVARATTASATCCSACWRPPTSRSPAAGTRCSATPTWRSSRRPRRSPPTCRGRWAWPSPSSGPGRLGADDALAGRRHRRVQLRRRLAQPLDRAGRAQRRRLHGPPGHAVPLLFVCEDNGMGISVPTPAGWVRGLAREPGRVCATSAPTAPTRSACRRRRGARRLGAPPAAARPCCTCAPCASAATPAPTSRRPTARAADVRADHARDPLLATARVLVEAGVATPDELVAPLPRRPRPRCATSPSELSGSDRRCAAAPR